MIDPLLDAIERSLAQMNPGALHPIAATLAAAWRTLQPTRALLAEHQLDRAIPGLDPLLRERIVRRMFDHLATLALEILSASHRPASSRAGRWPLTDMGAAGVVHVRGRHHLEAVLAEGRGALLLSAHLGNFELGLCAEAASGLPMTVLTKTMGSALWDARWRARRATFGVQPLPDDGSLTSVIKALRAGRCVAMTLDQHANPDHAVPTTFFGQTAATHKSLALLSARHRVPVVPVFATRLEPGVHRVAYLPPMPFVRGAGSAKDALAHNTQRYTTLIEAMVRAKPEQWTWLHRRWKG